MLGWLQQLLACIRPALLLHCLLLHQPPMLIHLPFCCSHTLLLRCILGRLPLLLLLLQLPLLQL
jgi:hypothetical protein